ncbi:hypothetical protein K435DRAFT_928280 [Dendrothele bispora CBS 962.96]|uniref:Epidermal growth factor receptor-like transmembrane-juxtamembrane segment domain-containing protein n=1 Tax=Dendrothele bispora (strain CBS 962.96) TaxID=1314807 RepID=A0A4S8MGS7_DENBC|nr:hypothetical protein K435DRAFT_887997 [Dendrothele bispora CBS 962.96]THV01334.1 hypothetical protein K435DRAFT_928280 [Dendrothele bispora CBS 962.96]
MLKGALILGSFVLSSVLLKTLAQDPLPLAKCTEEPYSGFDNSQGEDPCTLGTKVLRLCDRGSYISARPNGTYAGGFSGSDGACSCSTVLYTLLIICAECQGANTLTWDKYISNCSHIFQTELPPTVQIPPGLAIPHYAFLPLLSDGTVDFNAIREDAQPDVTANASSTTQSTSPTSTTNSPTQSQSADNEGGRTTHTGAIAGGVVGGVLGLVILAALVFFVRRRLIQKKAIDSAGNESSQPFSRWVTGPEGSNLRNSNGSETHKLYNPQDPTTFPVSASRTAANQPGESNPFRPMNSMPEV